MVHIKIIDSLTFDRMIEEAITRKVTERKAAEERAAFEAHEWDLALKEADRIARRQYASRKAVLEKNKLNTRATRAVTRTEKSSVASYSPSDGEDGSPPGSEYSPSDSEDQVRHGPTKTKRPVTPNFSDSDDKPTGKKRRLVSRAEFHASLPADTPTPNLRSLQEETHSPSSSRSSSLSNISSTRFQGRERSEPPKGRPRQLPKKPSTIFPENPEAHKRRCDQARRTILGFWTNDPRAFFWVNGTSSVKLLNAIRTLAISNHNFASALAYVNRAFLMRLGFPGSTRTHKLKEKHIITADVAAAHKKQFMGNTRLTDMPATEAEQARFGVRYGNLGLLEEDDGNLVEDLLDGHDEELFGKLSALPKTPNSLCHSLAILPATMSLVIKHINNKSIQARELELREELQR